MEKEVGRPIRMPLLDTTFISESGYSSICGPVRARRIGTSFYTRTAFSTFKPSMIPLTSWSTRSSGKRSVAVVKSADSTVQSFGRLAPANSLIASGILPFKVSLYSGSVSSARNSAARQMSPKATSLAGLFVTTRALKPRSYSATTLAGR